MEKVREIFNGDCMNENFHSKEPFKTTRDDDMTPKESTVRFRVPGTCFRGIAPKLLHYT